MAERSISSPCSKSNYFLPTLEFAVLILIMLSSHDPLFAIIGDNLQLPKPVFVAIALAILGLIHFAEQGKNCRHRNLMFRDSSGQGIVVAASISLTLCLSQLILVKKPLENIIGEVNQDLVFSSLYYLYMQYAVAMFFATLFYGTLYLCNMDITFLAPIIMLSLGFLQDHFTDINFVIPLTAVLLYCTMFMTMIKLCPKSFTIGEAAMISQGLALLLIDFTFLLVFKSGYGEYLDSYDLLLLENRTEETLLLSSLIASTVIISVCLSPIFYCLAWYAKSASDALVYSLAFYIGGIMNAAAVFIPSTYILLGINPLWYMISLMTSSIVFLVFYWTALLIIAVFIVIWNKDSSAHEDKKSIPKIVLRKSFHFIAILIFVPGIYFEPNFTKLAAGVSVAVLVILEYIRIFRIYPFGYVLHNYLTSFVDEKDKGCVILTHIYLLLGFSLPIWLFPFHSKSRWCPLLPYAGVISLGVGDSFASIIGKFYGRIKIPGTSKTFLGTLACTTSQFLVSLILLVWHNGNISWNSMLMTFLAVLITSVMEAATTQIDNLILSPVLYIAIILVGV